MAKIEITPYQIAKAEIRRCIEAYLSLTKATKELAASASIRAAG